MLARCAWRCRCIPRRLPPATNDRNQQTRRHGPGLALPSRREPHNVRREDRARGSATQRLRYAAADTEAAHSNVAGTNRRSFAAIAAVAASASIDVNGSATADIR